MTSVKSVQSYIDQSSWKEALTQLRNIMLETEMEECLKWGTPHYTVDGKIVVGFMGFKKHFALWFHQGVFLKDPANLLINAQEGNTKGLRQIRYNKAEEVDAQLVKSYVAEAIENQKKGLQIKPKKKAVLMPKELDEALSEDKALKQAFDALTPGKRKEYAEHIGSAKQASTRERRLHKAIPIIKQGKGLNDKYK